MIIWLLKKPNDLDLKPNDLDLHCLQRQGISWFSRTRVKIHNRLLQYSFKYKYAGFKYFVSYFALKKTTTIKKKKV